VRDGEGPRYVSKHVNACAAPRNGFLSMVGSSSALLRPHCRQYGNFASRLLCKMSAHVKGLASYQPAEVDIVFSRETLEMKTAVHLVASFPPKPRLYRDACCTGSFVCANPQNVARDP
jgi:hypothetical protein